MSLTTPPKEQPRQHTAVDKHCCHFLSRHPTGRAQHSYRAETLFWDRKVFQQTRCFFFAHVHSPTRMSRLFLKVKGLIAIQTHFGESAHTRSTLTRVATYGWVKIWTAVRADREVYLHFADARFPIETLKPRHGRTRNVVWSEECQTPHFLYSTKPARVVYAAAGFFQSTRRRNQVKMEPPRLVGSGGDCSSNTKKDD